MSVRVDEDRVVLGALEFEVPCQMVDAGCSCAATVAATCRRCGTASILCAGHLAAFERWFARQGQGHLVVACRFCKVHMPSFDAGIEVVDL